MAKRVFFSFHYTQDNWRAAQVRNAGVVEGNAPVFDNDWETITRGGDTAIQRWIDGQMSGKSCAIVLIGSHTADRKWINYEITKAWNDGKGLVGVYIHNLKDRHGNLSTKGINPFSKLIMNYDGRTPLSSVAKAYDPPYWTSTSVYNHINENLDAWVEEAVRIRRNW